MCVHSNQRAYGLMQRDADGWLAQSILYSLLNRGGLQRNVCSARITGCLFCGVYYDYTRRRIEVAPPHSTINNNFGLEAK